MFKSVDERKYFMNSVVLRNQKEQERIKLMLGKGIVNMLIIILETLFW